MSDLRFLLDTLWAISDDARLSHRDPFDRMMIAQAQVESLSILTADPTFARYGVALA